jgi:hypothetical protein
MEANLSRFTVAAPLLSRLPLELWEKIVDDLAMDAVREYRGINSLKNFALAASSHALLARCRKGLFARISIGQAVEAHRLAKVLGNNKELGKLVCSILIHPEPPFDEDEELSEEEDEEESSDEDDSMGGEGDEEGDEDDEGANMEERKPQPPKNPNSIEAVAKEAEDEEDDEDEIEWEFNENPLGHPSLLRLLSQLPKVKAVAVSGIQQSTRFASDYWNEDMLEEWIRFLSLPSITSLCFIHTTVPVDLLGRTPNLQRLDLHFTYICTFGLWDHAEGAFPKLEHLNIQQTDLMGTRFYDFVQLGYLNEGLKSETLRSLKLDGHRPEYDGDHWAWLGTLSVFTEFGANTLTTLTLSFPFGCFEREDSCKWYYCASNTHLK